MLTTYVEIVTNVYKDKNECVSNLEMAHVPTLRRKIHHNRQCNKFIRPPVEVLADCEECEAYLAPVLVKDFDVLVFVSR